MFQRFVLLFLTVGLLSTTAQAKNWDTFEVWQDYLSRHRTECFPPFAKLRKKPKLKIGKSVYRLEGTKLVELKPRRRAQTTGTCSSRRPRRSSKTQSRRELTAPAGRTRSGLPSGRGRRRMLRRPEQRTRNPLPLNWTFDMTWKTFK